MGISHMFFKHYQICFLLKSICENIILYTHLVNITVTLQLLVWVYFLAWCRIEMLCTNMELKPKSIHNTRGQSRKRHILQWREVLPLYACEPEIIEEHAQTSLNTEELMQQLTISEHTRSEYSTRTDDKHKLW